MATTTTKSILKNSIDSSQEDQSRKTSVGSSDGDDNTSRRSSILSASGTSMCNYNGWEDFSKKGEKWVEIGNSFVKKIGIRMNTEIWN